MPTVIFEGDSHQEIVQKVKRWLASVDAREDGTISAQQAVAQGAELTKDALRIIASAAPAPVAHSDLVKSLTEMGYKLTDTARETVIDGLDNVESLTGGGVLRKVSKAGRNAVYEMNSTVAKSILRSLAR